MNPIFSPPPQVIDPDMDNLVFWTSVPVDDYYLAPSVMQLIGNSIVAPQYGNSTVLVRNIDLSFQSKYYISLSQYRGTYFNPITSKLFLTDTHSIKVFAVALDGNNNVSTITYLSSFGGTGTGDGKFSIACDICGDGTHLYVTDRGNNRIQKFLESDYSFVSKTPSDDAEPFNEPSGIVISAGNIYVMERAGCKIQKRLASDLSFVAKIGSSGSGNAQFNGASCLCTDGTNLFVADTTNNRLQKLLNSDLSFVDKATVTGITAVTYISSNLYATTDTRGIKIYNISLILQSSSMTYSNTLSDTTLCDPTITTSRSTTIIWQLDNGTRIVTTGTTHAPGLNGFVGFFFATAGSHKVTVAVAGGLGLVTAFVCVYDAGTGIRNYEKCRAITQFDFSSNVPLALSISSIPKTVTDLKGALYGNLADLPPSLTTFSPWCTASTPVTGNFSNFPSTMLSFDGSSNFGAITAGSIAQLVSIRSFKCNNNAYLQADVDLVLKSIGDAIIANAAHFTYATPALNIGGTNQAPSGVYQAPSGPGGTITSGMEAVYVMCTNVGHAWTVTYNGGVKP
jgi:hypothetical protein